MNEYCKLIQTRYLNKYKLPQHNFFVRKPWHRPYNYAKNFDGKIIKIPSSAFCNIVVDNKLSSLAISTEEFLELGEAVFLLGKLLFTGANTQRYMNLYQAYECLGATPDIKFSSVRHSLSHASTALTRQNTIGTLEDLFGTVQIDLDNSKHHRIFYKIFSALLFENDKLLYDKLLKIYPLVKVTDKYIDLLHDWQVEEDHKYYRFNHT